jgi:acyl-CoA reductase-like NAD-dependent aldehyde dehydrogenase
LDLDPNTQVGPLSSEALIDILDQVERFEKAGAILVGGKERLILVLLCNLPID